jgi:hypothetical protein
VFPNHYLEYQMAQGSIKSADTLTCGKETRARASNNNTSNTNSNQQEQRPTATANKRDNEQQRKRQEEILLENVSRRKADAEGQHGEM